MNQYKDSIGCLETTAASSAAAAAEAASSTTTTTSGAAAEAASSTTTTTTTASSAFLGLTSFVHGQLTSLEFFSIVFADSFLGILICSHFHETKAFGSAGISFRDQAHGFNRADLRKKILQSTLGYGIGKIAYI
jgi:hypothetical protein